MCLILLNTYQIMSFDIPSQVYETLEQLVVNGGENKIEIIVHNTNKKGEGYTGEILYVTLKNKITHKEIHAIVKQAYRKQSIRDSVPVRDLFLNEIYFYTKVWSQFDQFQQQIPKAYHFQKLPKCLASVADENFEFLVMENLKFQSFQTTDKKVPLDKEHYEFILKEYGKFHGISFAYKALHPEEYSDLAKSLVDIYAVSAEKEFFRNVIKYAYEICAESLQPGIDDAVIQKLQPYIQNCMEKYLESVEGKTKYTVITHGDCWSNNMMFKYDQDSKKLTDVRFLDFQLARDASPCCDLSYCIYSGASKEILQDLDHYLQVYHDSLSETLKRFGCESEKLYPMQALKDDWKIFCNVGISMALMIWKIKFTYENELKDFTDVVSVDQENIFQGEYDKEAFRKSVKDLLYHLHDNNFL